MATTALAPVSGEVIAPKMGRPTTYRPEYCETAVEWFAVPALTQVINTLTTEETGEKRSCRTEARLVCANIPTWEGLAIKLGCTTQTLWMWEKRHPDFAEACARARDIYRDRMIQIGGLNLIAPATFTLLATNLVGMRVKQETEVTNATDSRVVELLRAMPVATRNTVIEALRAAEAKLAEVGQGAIEAGPAATEGA